MSVTVFEKSQKKSPSILQAKWATFLPVLPDRSIEIGQKLVEMQISKHSNETFGVICKQCVCVFSGKEVNYKAFLCQA